MSVYLIRGVIEQRRAPSRFNEMTVELAKKREIEAQLQQAAKIGRSGPARVGDRPRDTQPAQLYQPHPRPSSLKIRADDQEKREKFEKLTAQLKDEVARINQQISDFLNYSCPATADLKTCPTPGRSSEDSLRIVEAQARSTASRSASSSMRTCRGSSATRNFCVRSLTTCS